MVQNWWSKMLFKIPFLEREEGTKEIDDNGKKYNKK